MFRIAPVMLATVLFTTPELNGTASAASESALPVRSATKARDIGGFVLGMNIREAAKQSPVTAIGNDDYQTVRDGIEFDFGVTPLGRIYRVDSSQRLGRFVPDAIFVRNFTARLVSKYGPPGNMSAENFHWSLIEKVRDRDGAARPFETNWASAYFDDGPDVTVHIKLIDFRILWQDEAKLNRTPRDKAVEGLTL